MADAFKRLRCTLQKIKLDKKILYFIIAYFCYIDGVYTIISMATTYGVEVGIDTIQMIEPSFSRNRCLPVRNSGRKFGKKMEHLHAANLYVIIWESAFSDFSWIRRGILGSGSRVGLAQGGIQSLSRSYYAKIIRKTNPMNISIFSIFSVNSPIFSVRFDDVDALILKASKYDSSLIVLFLIGFFYSIKLLKWRQSNNRPRGVKWHVLYGTRWQRARNDPSTQQKKIDVAADIISSLVVMGHEVIVSHGTARRWA